MCTLHALVRNLSSVVVVMLVAGLLAAPPAAAQTAPAPPTAADFAKLQDELTSLRNEVASLRAAIGELGAASGPSAQLPAPQTAAPDVQPPISQVTPEMLDVLKSQIEEHAQSKVESASRMPVKLTGTILTNTYVNSGEGNWLENPNLVGNPSTESGARGSMSATARQSRIGLDVGGIDVGNWQASGTIIADFLGGVPGFQTGTVMGLPRPVRIRPGRVRPHRSRDRTGSRDPRAARPDVARGILVPVALPLWQPLSSRSTGARRAQAARRPDRDRRHRRADCRRRCELVRFRAAAGHRRAKMRPAFEGRLGFARGSTDTPRESTSGSRGTTAGAGPLTN